MEFPNKRYEGLHESTVLTGEEFKLLKNYMSCDIFNHIKILQRIGSDSLYATVWLVSLDIPHLETTFAVKVQKDIKKSEKEADISYKLERWFDNFLLMYYHIQCNEIKLNGMKYSGMFMFMEVAIADLKQMIKYQNLTRAKLLSYILDVCDSVEIMASNFLYHGDLHIGNVFIVDRDKKFKAVVGDFGESRYITSPTSHLSDMRTFIASLQTEIKSTSLNSLLVSNNLSTILKHIDIQTGKTEREYDEFMEKNRDPEIEDEFIISLVSRDMGIIKDLLQGIWK